MEYLIIGVVVLAAIAVVIVPLIRRQPSELTFADAAALEERVASYRAALRAGTVCDRCLRDNPEESKFCADCGRALDADAYQVERRQ